MQELNQTYVKWRKILLRTNLYMMLFVFVLEILIFIVLKKLDLIFQTIPQYLIWFLLIPTTANVALVLAGNIMIKHTAADSKFINYIPVVQLSAMCLVVACIHNIFSISLCIFSFPLFITAIFGEKKMIRNMGILCFLFLTFSLLYRRYAIYKPENDVYFFAEAIVAYVALCATIVISMVVIKFQEEKTNMIHQGYFRQIEMQNQLHKDQKTGLYGQTIFTNTLNQMVGLSEKTNKAILLAIIDIDDFKKINDTYGHLKGDQVILVLAEIMKSMFIDKQFISRFGGEEFAIIFSEGELEHAVSSLEELRIAFEKQKYGFMEDTVTISIGIAKWQPGWTLEQLFEAADSAMYSSKNSGKNRTMVYI